jgi:hypothetical protein
MPPLTGLFHFVIFSTTMSRLTALVFRPRVPLAHFTVYSSVPIARSEASPFPNAAALE